MATASKPKLSHTAKCILTNYQRDTKGCGDFLTDVMRRALVCKATRDLVACRIDNRDDAVSIYFDACEEVLDLLGV